MCIISTYHTLRQALESIRILTWWSGAHLERERSEGSVFVGGPQRLSRRGEESIVGTNSTGWNGKVRAGGVAQNEMFTAGKSGENNRQIENNTRKHTR